MLVNSFRNIQPFNILILFVVLILLRVPFLIKGPVIIEHEYAEPLSRLLFSMIDALEINRYFNVLITSLVVLLQALMLNRILIKYNILFKSSYLPALMYVIITGLFSSFYVLSPVLICNFFILIMLERIFSLKTNNQPLRTTFDLGLLAAINSLFYFPSIILVLIILLSLFFFRSFIWREWLAAGIGLLVPYFFMAVYYFMVADSAMFFNSFAPSASANQSISFSKLRLIVCIPIIIAALLSVKDVIANFYKNVIHARKSQQLMVVIILLSVIAVYSSSKLNYNHFMLCAAPLSVFSSYYFMLSKKVWLHETLLLLVLISVILLQIV